MKQRPRFDVAAGRAWRRHFCVALMFVYEEPEGVAPNIWDAILGFAAKHLRFAGVKHEAETEI